MEQENETIASVPTAGYEAFPDWLRDEIEQGSTLELRVKLRKALAKAVRESKGVLKQEGWNPEQRYTYTGHAEVMEACRQVMAENGLSIDQPLMEREAVITVNTARGEVPRWAWRVVCLVTHEDGGVLVRVVRPITMANDKASFVARTAADRVVMMNVMRIAGSKEDPEAENEANEAPRPKASTGQSSGQASSATSSQPRASSTPASASSSSAQSQASTPDEGPRRLNQTEKAELTKLVREIHGLDPADLDGVKGAVNDAISGYVTQANKPAGYVVNVNDYKPLHALLFARAVKAKQDRSAEGPQS